MDASIHARLDARRRRLERAVLALSSTALISCGPDQPSPEEDTGVLTVGEEQGSEDEIGDEGTDTDTETEAGEPVDCSVAMDVAREGTCSDLLGYYWKTGGCTPLYGCACEGPDCGELYPDADSCQADYGDCDACAPCPASLSCVVYCSGLGFLDGVECTDSPSCEEPYSPGSCEGSPGDPIPDADLYCAGLGRVVVTGELETDAGPSSPRERAGRAWARVAACEAASAEAFELLARQLEQLGAPTPLRRPPTEFAEDERRHARAAWAIARARGATEASPLHPQAPAEGLEALLEQTIVAGCIGETLSALELEHMAAACTDARIRATLEAMAAEEAAHAEHAWILLTWLLERWPRLRAQASAHFARPCDTVRLGLERAMPEHGLLDDARRDELWAIGRERVVRPLEACVLRLTPRSGRPRSTPMVEGARPT
ncbi:hypothetical protein PPSIR1_06326 [Plesiocystis pacifica SIR-1]|uniref:Uncharacterized protein n=1 Tax=Plesiocystis pacifica SIR-1 TaxID=391625 RepID=A6G6Z0_9BACT|nr:hypothetical protein [Plesiocystis pacifica]EDM78443.1 hypothetical protein PPSIR1_06326 [Plesiocystis pacifica SIR-1]